MALLDKTTVEVFQNDDPLKSFKLLKTVDSNLTPYDLTGATIEFIVKQLSTDTSALYSYSTTNPPAGVSITNATGGLFTVQFVRANLGTSGNFVYQLRVTQNSLRQTVAWGVFTVESV